MSRFFLDLNEKREAIRATREQPESRIRRIVGGLKRAAERVIYRIRRPTGGRSGASAHTGATVQDAMTDAARADLEVIELPGYFESERISRAWMKHGNAAGVVAGSYEEEISQPTLYVVEGRRR